MVTCQLKELSLNQSIGGPSSFLSFTPIQWVDVHFVQSSTKPNCNQQLGGNKKKGRGNNHKGGKNSNKPKNNVNNEKLNNHDGGGKKERQKVKFPYNICTHDHLTHLYPKLAEDAWILSPLLVVLTNPLPHNQDMALSSLNA
jgi:hypothetical protein